MALSEDFEAVLEELQDIAEQVLVPLDLPDHDDLVDIEEAILLPIPPLYRDFLLHASDLVIGSLEPATAADASSHTYLADMAAEAWQLGLPRELLPICQRANGFYAVNQDDEIVFWSPESGSEEAAESIWHWARDIWANS
ncbi:SMI1/KNR4 family protein [uncultured Pseudoteredinibacter sp.]|uniref:SMI1/KNR4 family protein n=1 Tax=uncultured Pseudoteredinibacter sp. TaxID=1641701 RepID=UPI00263919F7|nr:SMI1/KNR4 family protein [uncultured Pseudoteredinibacter sp.]